jgi:hypothetical protein
VTRHWTSAVVMPITKPNSDKPWHKERQVRTLSRRHLHTPGEAVRVIDPVGRTQAVGR